MVVDIGRVAGGSSTLSPAPLLAAVVPIGLVGGADDLPDGEPADGEPADGEPADGEPDDDAALRAPAAPTDPLLPEAEEVELDDPEPDPPDPDPVGPFVAGFGDEAPEPVERAAVGAGGAVVPTAEAVGVGVEPFVPVFAVRVGSPMGYWLAAALIRAAGPSIRLRSAEVTAFSASSASVRSITRGAGLVRSIAARGLSSASVRSIERGLAAGSGDVADGAALAVLGAFDAGSGVTATGSDFDTGSLFGAGTGFVVVRSTVGLEDTRVVTSAPADPPFDPADVSSTCGAAERAEAPCSDELTPHLQDHDQNDGTPSPLPPPPFRPRVPDER